MTAIGHLAAGSWRGGWLIFLAGLALTSALTPALARDMKMTDEVAIVNGDAITTREFVEALRRARALHDDGAKLRAAALEACVRFVVTLQLAREHGVTKVSDDAGLRGEFTAENARRASTLAKGGAVYGPRQLSWEQFRATWLDRIELELGRALLARNPPAPSAQPAPHADLRASRMAIDAARAEAKVQPDTARLAALDPNTPLPAP